MGDIIAAPDNRADSMFLRGEMIPPPSSIGSSLTLPSLAPQPDRGFGGWCWGQVGMRGEGEEAVRHRTLQLH